MPSDTSTPARPDFRELGVSGTRIFAGLVSEETVPQLMGFAAFRTYSGMRTDATCSALLKAIELPIRSARWYVNPASDKPSDVELADFVHDNLWEFGTQSMDDILRLAMTCLAYGFSWLEVVYAMIDQGPWEGKVGWDRLAWRSPATKWRWNLDTIGGRRQLVSVTQLAPPNYIAVDIPRNKLALFINDQEGDNWDGTSLLRPAFRDYFIREQLYRIRAIGLERGYMGIPVATLPDQFADDLRDLAKQIVETIRGDEQAGVVMPQSMGLEIVRWELNGPAMTEAVHYHNRQILLSQLAQFLDLGSGQAGAYSLSSDHSSLFLMALTAKSNYVAEVLNLDPLAPTLLGFNFPNLTKEQLPRVSHGDIGERSLDKLGRTLQALAQFGFLTPDDETEDRLRQMLNLPEREDTVSDRALRDLIQEVFPVGREYGNRPVAPRVPSPLEVAANKPMGSAGGQEGQGGRQDGPPVQPSSYSESRARLATVLARRRWERPRGRPTPDQAIAIKATEAFAEALDDVSGRPVRPPRPSEVTARRRHAYAVRFAVPDVSGAIGKPAAEEPPSGDVIARQPGQRRTRSSAGQDLARRWQANIQRTLSPATRQPGQRVHHHR